MQDLQRHLQQAVDSMMGRIDKSQMRPMQKDAYLCCSRCFDTSSASDAQIQNCIQNCQQPVQYNQQVMQREMNAFQVSSLHTIHKIELPINICRIALRGDYINFFDWIVVD